jgi:hypothetical protein
MSLQYTYATLATALQQWPETDDPEFVAALPNIISEGEDQLVREFGLQIFEANNVAAITANSNELEKPLGIISLEEMYYDDPNNNLVTQQLIRAHPDWIRAVNGSMTNPVLGSPRWYCENDTLTWLIAPTPNFTGTMNLQCIQRPDELSSDLPTGTSWLSTNYADILFLQCLMVAERFLKNDDRWAVAKREFDIQLPTAKTETSKLRRVLSTDHIQMADIQRPSNAEGPANTL